MQEVWGQSVEYEKNMSSHNYLTDPLLNHVQGSMGQSVGVKAVVPLNCKIYVHWKMFPIENVPNFGRARLPTRFKNQWQLQTTMQQRISWTRSGNFEAQFFSLFKMHSIYLLNVGEIRIMPQDKMRFHLVPFPCPEPIICVNIFQEPTTYLLHKHYKQTIYLPEAIILIK